MSHIVGKVYDISKETINKLIEELEALKAELEHLKLSGKRINPVILERDKLKLLTENYRVILLKLANLDISQPGPRLMAFVDEARATLEGEKK